MNWSDVSNFQIAASRLLQHIECVGNRVPTSLVDDFHRAKEKVSLSDIPDVMARFDIHCDDLTSVYAAKTAVGDLMEAMDDNPDIEAIVDTHNTGVYAFCNGLMDSISKGIDEIKQRGETEPSPADIAAVKKFLTYWRRQNKHKPFGRFITENVIKGLSPQAAAKRLKYLIVQCDDEQGKRELRAFLKRLGNASADSTVVNAHAPTAETKVQQHAPQYSPRLLELFNGKVGLIEELIGLSDDEIAKKIRQWAGEKDKFGKPKIQNPGNRLKKDFAEELKHAGLIEGVSDNFRKKL